LSLSKELLENLLIRSLILPILLLFIYSSDLLIGIFDSLVPSFSNNEINFEIFEFSFFNFLDFIEKLTTEFLFISSILDNMLFLLLLLLYSSEILLLFSELDKILLLLFVLFEFSKLDFFIFFILLLISLTLFLL